jgi:hypothetical protein
MYSISQTKRPELLHTTYIYSMIPPLAEPLLGVVRSEDPSLVTDLHLLPLYLSSSQLPVLRTGIQPGTTVLYLS